jgi:topoisomerase-4 subunit A
MKRDKSGVRQKRAKKSTSRVQKGRVRFEGKEQITGVNLTEFSIKNTKIYGAYTIEQRALSDFRDGLKPVHRRILWSMFNLGLHNNGGFKKCARTVGDVIGKYHPHGDAACYQAMVSIACSVAIDKKNGGMKTDWTNTPCPLVDGQGNFGGIGAEDRAAAARYTESKLSKFADIWMLDPDYLAVSTMVPNFDGEEKEPVILPAKLPYILLGGCEGIATGVSTFIPTFSQESVIKLIKKLLTDGEPATAKMCMRFLKFKFSNGGVCTSPDNEVLDYFKTGKGTLTFQPIFEINGDIVNLKSSAPRFSIENKLTKLAAINGVVLASDDSDRHVGRNVNITLKKRLEPKDKAIVLSKIDKEITTSLSLQTAVTERLDDGETVKFRYTTIPALLNKWIEWRIELELKVVAYRISKSERDLERLTLLQLAAQNKETMKAMLDKDDPIKFIIGKLKFNGARLTDAQANFLLDIRFRQLTKLNVRKLLEDIKTVKIIIINLKKDLKNPNARILKTL